MEDFLQMKKNIGRLKVLEKKFACLKNQISKQNDDVSTLLFKYEKEKKDVLHMQDESFTAFFQRMTGRYDKRMEKEIREEMDAKLKYDEAKSDLEEMKSEYKQLMTEILEIKKLSIEFDREVKRRREVLFDNENDEGMMFRKLESEISYCAEQLTEISHALTTSNRVLETARSAMQSLDKAEGWATYDVWLKGGIITHAAKYAHIDDAQSKFNVLISQLKSLKNELSEVDNILYGNLTEISSSQRAIDFWFDNIFTNLSVRSQIRDNMDTLRQLMGKVTSIEVKLLETQKNLDIEIRNKESKQEEILYAMQAITK